MADVRYKCVYSVDDILAYIDDAKEVAFDFETASNDEFRDTDGSALDPYMSHPVGISFSVREQTGIYVPLCHKNCRNVGSDEMSSFLRWFFRNPQIVKIAHNLAFEASIAYVHYGIVIISPVYDTIAAAQLVTNGDFCFRKLNESGLKTLAHEVCGEALPTFEEVTQGRQFDELNPETSETVRYGCADADFCLRLFHVFNAWFATWMPTHRWITENMESPVSVYIGIMQCVGVPIDGEYLYRKRQEAMDMQTRLKGRIESFAGGIDVGKSCNNANFKNYLYRTLSLPVVKFTDKGAPSVDDESIKKLRKWASDNIPDMVSFFDDVLDYRSIGKVLSTYIDGYAKHIHQVTGRIHPHYLSLSTDTGRMSCNRPNVQNMPRKNSDPIGIRAAIVPPDGCKILSLDFSQIELRVGAFFSRDARMIETFKNGGDIHAQTTSIIFGIGMDEASDKSLAEYKERRSIAKNVNFGILYGLYPKGLQKTLQTKAGIIKTLEECEAIINRIKDGYPNIVTWQEHTKIQACMNCYTDTIFGRKRFLPDIRSASWSKRSSAERRALNAPVQGTAADLIKMAMVRVLYGLQERPWLHPVLQIHDELVFIVPEAMVDEAVKYVKACMEISPFDGFEVPLVAEASVGDNFGAMKDL